MIVSEVARGEGDEWWMSRWLTDREQNKRLRVVQANTWVHMYASQVTAFKALNHTKLGAHKSLIFA